MLSASFPRLWIPDLGPSRIDGILSNAKRIVEGAMEAHLAGLRQSITADKCKQLLIDLVRVPSPQTALMEAEPLLRKFIETAVEPRLRAMGFADIRYDSMGNLISTFGENRSGASLMLITNAMNQPAATMKNAYSGDVADGAPFGLPGQVVLGKGASEQKANMAAMLAGMEAVLMSGIPIVGRLVHVCCVSGETGSHAAIRSVVEAEGVRADMAVLGGTSLMATLGNRGRIDVFITVHGVPTHSSRPRDGANAITGAVEAIRRLATEIRLDRTHPDLGPQTLTVNRIRSFPDSTHTIQASCELTIDRRLLPGDDPDEAYARIAAVAKSIEAWPDPASGKPFRVEARLGPFMYPSLVTTQSPVVRELFAACRAAFGREPETLYSPAAFDQGYLNHVGIPTVNWGPGEYKFAHTDFDLASVERTRDAALVYAAMILRRLA
jgi:acetylornithine deacetylase/succinyl-diaminopimelate desuccinylase-like protein